MLCRVGDGIVPAYKILPYSLGFDLFVYAYVDALRYGREIANQLRARDIVASEPEVVAHSKLTVDKKVRVRFNILGAQGGRDQRLRLKLCAFFNFNYPEQGDGVAVSHFVQSRIGCACYIWIVLKPFGHERARHPFWRDNPRSSKSLYGIEDKSSSILYVCLDLTLPVDMRSRLAILPLWMFSKIASALAKPFCA